MVQIDCDELQKKIWDEGMLINRNTIMGMCAAVNINKNMMFSGVPGTGKTKAAQALAKTLFGGSPESKYNNKFHRITATPGITKQEFFGDWNYQKQFLEIQASCSSKTCKPDAVEHVYRRENFIDGPALEAIKNDGILFIDEGNRGGEDFQNMILEVAEEKQVTVPLLGTVRSTTPGLPITIVTYNEHDTGTQEFSDAFKRRFMRIKFSPLNRVQAEQAFTQKIGPKRLDNITSIVKKAVS